MDAQRSTLNELFAAGIDRNTTGVCAATKRNGTWIETSTDDFRAGVTRFALGLHHLGIRKGDRVALHAENSAEWLLVDQAILSLGAVTVPIYTTQPPDQIRYILQNAKARGYVVSTEALFRPLAGHLQDIPTLEWTVGLRGTYDERMLGFDDVLQHGRTVQTDDPTLFDTLSRDVHPDDLASLVYTSGTTGVPKGVRLSHWNIASNVLACLERIPFDIEANRGERMLSYLPLSHVFERMLTKLYLHIGYPIYFVEDHREFIDDVAVVRPIHFSTVPRLLEKVYVGIRTKMEQMTGLQGLIGRWALALADAYRVEERPTGWYGLQMVLADVLVFRKLRERFGGRMAGITSGGGALSAQVMQFINAIGIFCAQGYGLTETSPVVTVYERDPAKLRAGSVGTPIRDVEVRIAGDGEILVRGPNVMQGYFEMPDETAEVLSDDGWLRTGDIGHLDEDGYLYITDRKKSLFKLSTGKYVAPQPIEVQLGASPFVEQAMVVGNERKFCAALIVPDLVAVQSHLEREGVVLAGVGLGQMPDVERLFERLIDEVNRELPPWEQIKKFSLLQEPLTVDRGELTPTLKLRRRVILERYADAVEALYVEPKVAMTI